MKIADYLNQVFLTLLVMMPINLLVLGSAFAAEFLCSRCR